MESGTQSDDSSDIRVSKLTTENLNLPKDSVGCEEIEKHEKLKAELLVADVGDENAKLSALECDSGTEVSLTETSDVCQVTINNCKMETASSEKNGSCEVSSQESGVTILDEKNCIEILDLCDSNLVECKKLLHTDKQEIEPSFSIDSPSASEDTLYNTGRTLTPSVTSENERQNLSDPLECQNLEMEKSDADVETSASPLNIPVNISCNTASVSIDNHESEECLVRDESESVEVHNLTLENYSNSARNSYSSASICESPRGENVVAFNLVENETNVKDEMNFDPKLEMTLGELIKSSDPDEISTVLSNELSVSTNEDQNISGSSSCDPILNVDYLRDDSIDEYSSKEATTASVVDQLCLTSAGKDSETKTEKMNGEILIKESIKLEDQVLLVHDEYRSPCTSNTQESISLEFGLGNSSTSEETLVEKEASFGSEKNDGNEETPDKPEESKLETSASSVKLKETSLEKKDISVKPEISSLKQSVFKVFRDVAKSVNKEQVNETFNENIKQVYRNVWKNVASESFPGQSFMNKFQADGSSIKKSSSNEKLTSAQAIQENSNVCDSSEVLTSSQSTSPSHNLKLKSGISSEVSSVSNLNSDSTQCGSQLSLTALGLDSEEGQQKMSPDAFHSETLATSLSQYMYRASLSDLRLKASPPTPRADVLTREYQSDLNVNHRVDNSKARLTPSFACNERDKSLLSQNSFGGSGETIEGKGLLGASDALENLTLTDIKSSMQISSKRNSVGRNLIEDLNTITSQTLDILEEMLSPQKIQQETTEHLQGKNYGEIEANINKSEMSEFKCQLPKLEEKHLKIRGICKSLTSEVERLEAAASPLMFQTQLSSLEEALQKCQNEAAKQKHELQEQHQQQLEQQISARAALTDKLERLTKLYNEANANKEAMVVKYAVAEKNVLVAQKQRDAAERKCKDLEKDKDVLLARVKNISAEKTRITSILDKKISECSAAVRDVERLKEDVSARDIKIKWTQAKLTSEMDTLKAVQARLDAAEAQISSVRQEAADTVQEARMDETSRANMLDKEVTEHKSRLIVEENCVRKLREELAAAKSKIATLSPQNASLSSEVATLKQQLMTAAGERAESEALFRSLQQQLHAAQQHSTALQHSLDQLPLVRQQLQQATSELEAQKAAVQSSEQRCSEHTSELELLRSKEAELLSFTQLLSETNSRVQSELNALTEAERKWSEGKKKLEADVQHWQQACADTKQQLTSELTDARSRLETVCSELGQQSGATQRLLQRVAELEGDLALERKRHANLVKDLNRELQKLRRKAEGDAASDKDTKRADANGLTLLQNGCSGTASRVGGETHEKAAADRSKVSTSNTSSNASQDNLSLNSRASSQTSLNETGTANATAGGQSQQTIMVPDMQASNELLVQRIVKLQKSLARRTEKEEFYEEHVAQLVAELQKKNRIIDYFVMKEEVGTMPDNRADAAKARMMQQKGIMSSIYGSQQKDEAMTLDLSLEINRKLQALFEDTLLKNITLKESLSTLGDEVARLSLHASRRQ